jgi:hypothetical protein
MIDTIIKSMAPWATLRMVLGFKELEFFPLYVN